MCWVSSGSPPSKRIFLFCLSAAMFNLDTTVNDAPNWEEMLGTFPYDANLAPLRVRIEDEFRSLKPELPNLIGMQQIWEPRALDLMDHGSLTKVNGVGAKVSEVFLPGSRAFGF